MQLYLAHLLEVTLTPSEFHSRVTRVSCGKIRMMRPPGDKKVDDKFSRFGTIHHRDGHHCGKNCYIQSYDVLNNCSFLL